MANINEKIYIGSVDTPTLSFDQRSIENIVCNNSVDLIGDELSSDTLEVSVFFDDEDEILRNIAYGTPIFYYSNDYLVGKYYVSGIERKGLKKYLIRSTSLIGLIEKENFYGGFYSGETFDNVLNDILFTNGLSQSKYYLYTPVAYEDAGGASQPVLFDKGSSVMYWKYRIHLEFVCIGITRPIGTLGYTGDAIAGHSGQYYAYAQYNLDSDTGYYYWTISATYNNSYYYLARNQKLIGTGSTVTIDIDPVAGTVYLASDYIKYDDPTVTGHVESTGTVRAASSSRALNFKYVYGASNTTKLNLKLQWKVFQYYDENGVLVLDAIMAKENGSTTNYIINKVNLDITETAFLPYGNSIGVLSDYDKRERDEELANSIEYAPGIAALPINGWIDSGTRREALHKLLFAESVCMLNTDDGKFLFTQIANSAGEQIQDGNIYDDSEEKAINGAMTINVTEHSFEENSDAPVTLFDNSSAPLASGTYIALFDKSPIFGTPETTSGLTIVAFNCNAALVTGRGIITGTPYTHSKNVIKYRNPDLSDGKDLSVSNIGLVTSANSDTVMNKLKSYYSGNSKKITNSLIYDGEKCGIKYLFKTLYGNSNLAFLTKLTAKSSSFVKAACEFVSGYVSPGVGGYTNFAIQTYGETWEVPEEVRSKEYPNIRLNIIGKGHDGTAGSNGQPGTRGDYGAGALPGGAGGEGGAAGAGGDGGNIYSLTIDAANVKTISVSYSGYNTIVQTYNDSGTLLNSYTSATGVTNPSGFLNIFNGFYYGRKGKDGIKGGNGGQGGYITTSSGGRANTVKGASGEDAGNYSGGESFDCIVNPVSTVYGTGYEYNSYGGGGGAAYGNTGGNAYTGNRPSPGTVETYAGNGANAIVPDNVYTEYGSGGFGGNGGGGGGGAGTRTVATPDEYGNYGYYTYYYWSGGYGTGSAGTPGIDGCCIIYF